MSTRVYVHKRYNKLILVWYFDTIYWECDNDFGFSVPISLDRLKKYYTYIGYY